MLFYYHYNLIHFYRVTCSRHLNLTDFEVGASCSIALQGKAKTGYPRVSRGSFLSAHRRRELQGVSLRTRLSRSVRRKIFPPREAVTERPVLFIKRGESSDDICLFFYTYYIIMIVKQHGGVLPWAAMPLTAGNDRKKAAALISQNRHQ